MLSRDQTLRLGREVFSISGRVFQDALWTMKSNLYNKYSKKVGDLFVGEVYQVWKRLYSGMMKAMT